LTEKGKETETEQIILNNIEKMILEFVLIGNVFQTIMFDAYEKQNNINMPN